MSIGQELANNRRKKQIDHKQAEEDTKIRVKFLEAMERDDFDVLPEPVYVKGFIRTYANYLGADGYQLVQDYERLIGEKTEEEKAAEKEEKTAELKEMIASEAATVKGGTSVKPEVQVQPKKRGFPWLATFISIIALFLLLLGTLGQLNPPRNEQNSAGPKPVEKQIPKPKPKAPAPPKDLSVRLRATDIVWVQIKKDGRLYFTGNMVKNQLLSCRAMQTIEVVSAHGNMIKVSVQNQKSSLLSNEYGVARRTFNKAEEDQKLQSEDNN